MTTFDRYRIECKNCDINCRGCKRYLGPKRKNISEGRAAKRRAKREDRQEMERESSDR
jgi:hypothetical protein